VETQLNTNDEMVSPHSETENSVFAFSIFVLSSSYRETQASTHPALCATVPVVPPPTSPAVASCGIIVRAESKGVFLCCTVMTHIRFQVRVPLLMNLKL